MIDQDPAHLGGRHRIEVIPGVEIYFGAAHQKDECFVDERSWLEGMVAALLTEVAGGNLVERRINLAKQLLLGLHVAVRCSLEKSGNIAQVVHRNRGFHDSEDYGQRICMDDSRSGRPG